MSFRQTTARLAENCAAQDPTYIAVKHSQTLTSDDKSHKLDEVTEASVSSGSKRNRSANITLFSAMKSPSPLDAQVIPMSRKRSKELYAQTSTLSGEQTSPAIGHAGVQQLSVVSERTKKVSHANRKSAPVVATFEQGSDYTATQEQDVDSDDYVIPDNASDTDSEDSFVAGPSKKIIRRLAATSRPARVGRPVVRTNKYGFQMDKFKELDSETQAIVKNKYHNALTRLVQKAKKSGQEAPRKSFEPEATALCSEVWKYFRHYGIPWDSYHQLTGSEKRSISSKYHRFIDALRGAHPNLGEEELHRRAREETAANFDTNGVVVQTEKLKDGQVLVCALCNAVRNGWESMNHHLLHDYHDWSEGGSCPNCKDTNQTFSTVELFRRHIRMSHVILSSGTVPKHSRITASSAHLLCSQCKSCIYSPQQHSGWCAATKFSALFNVIAGASSAAPSPCLCNEFTGRADNDEWRNTVLLDAMYSTDYAESLLKTDHFETFRDLIAQLRKPKSQLRTSSSGLPSVEGVYVVIELSAIIERITFSEFVRNIIYVGSATGSCWNRALKHISHSLQPTENDFKSFEHIRRRVHRAILRTGPRIFLVPLTLGGEDGNDFGSAAEAIEMLAMVVLGMPNLLNTLALSLCKKHSYESRLVAMFEHAGEIVSAIIYSTWLKALDNKAPELPLAIDLADEKTVEEFQAWDEYSAELKASALKSMERHRKEQADNDKADSANINFETSSACETNSEPRAGTVNEPCALSTPMLSSQEAYAKALELVAHTGKPLEEFIAWLQSKHAEVLANEQEDRSSINGLELLRPSAWTGDVATSFRSDQETLQRGWEVDLLQKPREVASVHSSTVKHDWPPANDNYIFPEARRQATPVHMRQTPLALNRQSLQPTNSASGLASVFDVQADNRNPTDCNGAITDAKLMRQHYSATEKFGKERYFAAYEPALQDDPSSSDSKKRADSTNPRSWTLLIPDRLLPRAMTRAFTLT